MNLNRDVTNQLFSSCNEVSKAHPEMKKKIVKILVLSCKEKFLRPILMQYVWIIKSFLSKVHLRTMNWYLKYSRTCVLFQTFMFFTLTLHLVTATNLRVWLFPKSSSLHNISTCVKKKKNQWIQTNKIVVFLC